MWAIGDCRCPRREKTPPPRVCPSPAVAAHQLPVRVPRHLAFLLVPQCISAHMTFQQRAVTVELKNRRIRVKGKRGTLQRSFTHVNVDMVKKGNVIVVDCWWADRKVCLLWVCLDASSVLFCGCSFLKPSSHPHRLTRPPPACAPCARTS